MSDLTPKEKELLLDLHLSDGDSTEFLHRERRVETNGLRRRGLIEHTKHGSTFLTDAGHRVVDRK